MKRPTRIAVFGVLCLVIGGFVGIHNFDQLGVALGGPESVEIPTAEEAPGQMGKMLRDTALAVRGALDLPVYRTGLGIKSLLSLAMAGMLIAVGVGLMRDRLWSIRFTRIWAAYAIVAAVATAFLHTQFIVPEIPASAKAFGDIVGGKYLGMALMMAVLCIFPALLLLVLPKPHVVAYLRERASTKDSPSVLQAQAPEPGPADQQQAQAPMPDQDLSQTTWRDDPWNDPGSR